MALPGKCFCCGLQEGVTVLGWISVIFQIIMLTICYFSYEHYYYYYSVINYGTLSFLQCLIATSIVGLLTNATLLYATNKGKKLLLLPWLVSHAPGIFFFPISILITDWKHLMNDEMMGDVLVIYIVGLSIAAFLIYCWLCVLGLYRQFDLEDKQKRSNYTDRLNLLNNTSPITLPPPYEHFHNLHNV